MRTEIFKTVNNSAGVTNRILNFLAYANNFFVCIGKPTPWTGDIWGMNVSDTNPPIPDESIVSIPEPIIYKRVQRALPALHNTACAELVIDPTQSLSPTSLTEKTFSLIDPNTIYETDGSLRIIPTYLYISTTIEYEDYEVDSFRAIGFYTNVTFKSGVDTSKLVYTPSEIKTSAVHWTSFSTPVLRAANKDHHLEFLMQL